VAAAKVGERRVHFAPAGVVTTPVYARARLPLGGGIPGPAIVEQADTTTVVPPGWTIAVEESGNLRLRRTGRG
jgi:N-methylhydantoinase A